VSILTDFIVAAPSEAEAICADQNHHNRWPCLQLKSLDNIKLSALLSVFGEQSDAEALEGETFLIHCPSKEGPWVFHLPDVLTDHLSKLDSQTIPSTAAQWAENEELQFDGWSESDVEPVLEMLCDIARKAKSEQKSLLLWMCL